MWDLHCSTLLPWYQWVTQKMVNINFFEIINKIIIIDSYISRYSCDVSYWPGGIQTSILPIQSHSKHSFINNIFSISYARNFFDGHDLNSSTDKYHRHFGKFRKCQCPFEHGISSRQPLATFLFFSAALAEYQEGQFVPKNVLVVLQEVYKV